MSGNCYLCGESNSAVLEQHHIVPKRYNGTNRQENLVTLCSNCHKKIERIYNDRAFGKIISEGNHSGDQDINSNSWNDNKSIDKSIDDYSQEVVDREEYFVKEVNAREIVDKNLLMAEFEEIGRGRAKQIKAKSEAILNIGNRIEKKN